MKTKLPYKKRYFASTWVGWVIVGTVVLLIGFRVSLPFIVKHLVLRAFNSIPNYTATVGDIDMFLWRGAYEINSVNLFKINRAIEKPLVTITQIEIGIAWDVLFKGMVLASMKIVDPEMYVIESKEKERRQVPAGKPWQEIVKNLFPIQLDYLSVVNGRISMYDYTVTPTVNAYIKDIDIIVTDISNRNTVGSLQGTATIMNSGKLRVNGTMQPLQQPPGFAIKGEIDGLHLPSLNDAFKAYGAFDVTRGTFDLFTEFEVDNGVIDGYVKPLFYNLEIFTWDSEVTSREDALKIFWEGIIGTVAEAFENQPKDQLATRIPLSGTLASPDADFLTVFALALQNAFINALLPQFK